MHESAAFSPRECVVMSEVAAQPAARNIALCFRVMAGLVPASHVLGSQERKTWIPGTSARSKASSPRPGMTARHSPRPFIKGGKFMHDSDAFAPRECGVMSEVAAQPAARKIALCFRVMAGLVPAIHVLESKERKTGLP